MFAVHVDTTALRQLMREVDRMRAQIPVAIARGLNEGGDKVRTQVQRAMREQTGLLRLKSVTSRERTMRAYAVGAAPKSGIGPSRPAKLAYTIIFTGKPSTRPEEFAYRMQKGPGGGVTVRMWGVDHRFPRSYQIAGFGGAGGLRMRLGRKRLPVRGFDGPNLAKEAVKDKVAETFMTQSLVIVPPMIEKHLARLLR